jgi:biopolymer transport protein TolQ
LVVRRSPFDPATNLRFVRGSQRRRSLTDAVPQPIDASALFYNRQKDFPYSMPSFPVLAIFVGGEIVDLVLQTGAVAKVVLFILIAFSVLSWAVILSKWRLISRARTQSSRFVRSFRKAQRMQDVASVVDQFRPSPLVDVFEGAVAEFKRQLGSTGTIHNLPAIQRSMQIASSEGITRLERNVPWLAITGAVTPFVGLFGTVWGIIDAFHGLGTAGAATLRAVAPGISEALITTAAGLAAAIPAVIAYNLIIGSIRELAARNDDFSLEMLNLVERQTPQPVEARR